MDNRGINRRLEVLERWSVAEATKRTLHAPYSEIRILSISKDVAHLLHHSQGNYGAADELGEMSIAEAAVRVLETEGAGFIRMEFSPEWLHCFIMASDLYTPEQKQRTKTDHLELWPEISWIYERENPDTLISDIASIPQSFCIKGGKK